MSYYERNQQRKQEIEDGLLELMGKMPYDEITIKDLTEKLNMARKNFYYYFPNKQACLESLIDRMIYTCSLNLLETLQDQEDLEKLYEGRFRFWMAHKDFLDAVNRNDLGSFFLDRFLRYIQQEDKVIQNQMRTPEVDFDEDILFFYMSGQLYLLLKWCHAGFPLTVEEMVRKTLRLIRQPLLQLDQER